MSNPAPKILHVVFKTHLDVGFTDFAANVTDAYLNSFIPRAIAVAKELRETGAEERFLWTTGSWLIYEYLERSKGPARKAMEEAIVAGDIAWHALPFTTHTELMGGSLLRFGLSLSQELDERFGRKTIAAKMTDVPGHTRAMVPYLAEAGVQMLHIGVNPASRSPKVPPVFRWQHNDGSEVVVVYNVNYGGTNLVEGMDEALTFGHTGDNQGPQNVWSVVETFLRLRREFPQTQVIASTLDAFARRLVQFRDKLPIVTEDLGDTWIHGAGTDPIKVARFRQLCRLREELMGRCTGFARNKHFKTFSRLLMMIPEHTWGLDIKSHLNDYRSYDAKSFAAARKLPNFKKVQASWAEQRQYLADAVAELKGSVAQEAKLALAELKPALPKKTGFKKISDLAAIETPRFTLGIDPATGAINHLVHKAAGRTWADAQHPLATFGYEVFSQNEYDAWLKNYCINMGWPWHAIWATPDFSKPGVDKAIKEARKFAPTLRGAWRHADKLGETILIELACEKDASALYGCPRKIVVKYHMPAEAAQVRVELQWFDKPACRIAEALWMSFNPIAADAPAWMMDKLGWPISPLEVIDDGNKKLHALGRGVTYGGHEGQMAIETLDAPLVAVGDSGLLNFNNSPPDLSKGWHFNLFNNVWGSNFPMWFEEDAKFRFVLSFA